ncbi:MAG: transcriptional repressor [Candidatus Eremiobacteraeota bacterium]|nr:transcriptional repressor [Candidatus Eremiobacteraeota bacterium]
MQKMAASNSRPAYSTSSRRAILGLLQGQRRYLTVAEIHNLLVKRKHRMALTTVYRTLQHLSKLGAVTNRADASGEMAYLFCANDEHHHHAICNSCGHVEEVNCRIIDEFKKLLLTRQAFALDEHSIEFYGRCAACR